MKTVFGFIVIVFSVIIFAPKSNNITFEEVMLPDIDHVETHHYIPSREVIESRNKLEECERMIRANITYLKANENTKTN